MKLTKAQLKQIIKEELDTLSVTEDEEQSVAPEVAAEIKRIVQTLRDTQAAMRAVVEKVAENKFDFNHILPQNSKDILKYASGLEPAAERLELLLKWSELDEAKMMQERVEHPLEGAAASAGSIAGGLRKGLLTPESAADRIEKEVKKALYDFIRRAKGQ